MFGATDGNPHADFATMLLDMGVSLNGRTWVDIHHSEKHPICESISYEARIHVNSKLKWAVLLKSLSNGLPLQGDEGEAQQSADSPAESGDVNFSTSKELMKRLGPVVDLHGSTSKRN